MDLTVSPHSVEAALKTNSHYRFHTRPAAASVVESTSTIAISRAAGALGSSVGQELALRLGWELYDHELLNRIAAELGLRPSLLDTLDERPTNWVRELLNSLGTEPRLSSAGYAHQLTRLMTALAARGKCIIVGRGAPHLLPAESTLRVRLVAPRAFRIAAIQKAQGISTTEAERWMDKTDRERIDFIKQWPGKDPTDPALYDLVINVARFTVAQTADLILAALRSREQEQ